MFESLKNHWQIVREAYRAEKERTAQSLPIHQKDFLPAALSVMEKPASPAGRFTIWLIVIFFTIALLWAYFGKIDVVAVATGKIVPEGQIKVVQSFEPGVVLGIYVANGTRVSAGDVLLELDSTVSNADIARLQNQWQTARITKEKNTWLLAALVETVTEKSPVNRLQPQFEYTEGLDIEMARVQQLLAVSQLNEYRAVQSAFEEQLNEKQGELNVTNKQLDKLTTTLPLLEEQVAGMTELSGKGITARFQLLEYQERLLARRQDLIIEQERVQQVKASIRAIKKQQEQHQQEFRKLLVSELAEATNGLIVVEQELKKAELTNQLQRLRASVDGVVQQLNVHTIGGVVRPGDPLMAIVPADRKLQVEAKILNRDIGFVAEGQVVEVKLEAFPFTKYGVVEGILVSIDRDAVLDEELGLVYPARISIEQTHMQVDEKAVPLSPGMSLTAELKIGKRRLIEFLLAPLLRYKEESLRER